MSPVIPITPKLPSRYESLDPAFRGRLKPNEPLNGLVKRSLNSISINGGIRFLSIFGESGSGKSCAAREVATHLPECSVYELSREAVESGEQLRQWLKNNVYDESKRLHIIVIDQYEEAVAEREAIPTRFVESISILDRDGDYKYPTLFVWLTTSPAFRQKLVDATSRNRRILLQEDFDISGPAKEEWPGIIEETFEFHNGGKSLADFGVVESDVRGILTPQKTIGSSIEAVSNRLFDSVQNLHDISQYQVVMLWPVTDGLRITRVAGFTNPREGYVLNWNALYKEMNDDERANLPLEQYNRARLYFDMRLVPIVAADIQPICRDIEKDDFVIARSYLNRFDQTHLMSVVKGVWTPESYSPLRERVSKRASEAKAWYDATTTQPTRIGARLAQAMRGLGLNATHEETIRTPNASVRADVFVSPNNNNTKSIIIELKAFSTENTRPSSIKSSILTTLRRHAQLAGFIPRS